ncbi:MAG: DUF4173 domain-containing protein [Pyrinomonadaceae bacterium]|nr:DUF4173 domain-containing protein [Pyrinomonadaceae bacterium]
MKERTKLGLGVLEAALLLGLLGDMLLRATPWGLNVFLWTGTLCMAVVALSRRKRMPAALSDDGHWLLLCVIIFAAAPVWRDSPTLKLLDVSVVLAALALAAWRSRGGSIRLAGLTEYAAGCVVAAGNTVFGFFPLVLSDIIWKEIPRTKWSRRVMPVVRGLIIAVPLLFVFGALLTAADAIFEGLMRDTFRLDGERVMTHALVAILCAWVSGGFLRGMFLGGDVRAAQGDQTILTTLRLENQSGGELSGTRNGVKDIHTRARGDVDKIRDDNAAATRDDENSIEKPRGFADGNSVTDEIAPNDINTNATSAGTAAVTTETNDAPPDIPVTSETKVNVRAANVSATNDVGVGMAANTTTQADNARQPEASKPHAPRLSLGVVEVGVVLGLINILFLSFVVVQVKYFFGGVEMVTASAGLTYAEYARRGFFELVTVAALVLPMLLAAHWLLRKESPAHERIFRVLAGAQVALLFVIMASALGRMRLYQSEYGLTELRLYTTAFMGWLGIVFAWFGAVVLWRGERERFACGALVAGLLVIGLLHLVNPDALIVRTNVARTRAERAFDAGYAASLSADAVPALVGALPQLNAGDRGVAAHMLLSRWKTEEAADWRTWNMARAEAERAVRDNEVMLSDLARTAAAEKQY